MSKIKKIALISTFCDTQDKLKILEENILKIKKMDIDVIVYSPTEIPQKIVDLCDYFFFTKENPVLQWPIRMYTHWFEMQLTENKITTLQRGLGDYGWAGLYQVKKLSQIALTFDYDIYYHLIYDLEIDEVVEDELKSNVSNILHPRINPNNTNEFWETTLHFMVFDKDLMKKIENEITLDDYLSTNGIAEDEVMKWKNKFDITISNHPVKDKIFYWENFNFFDYSPFPEFKMFLSKNESMTIWLGESQKYETTLNDNLKIVFYDFDNINQIIITINGINYIETPRNWEIIELPVSSQKISELIFTYNDKTINFTKNYEEISLNQIYYNYKP